MKADRKLIEIEAIEHLSVSELWKAKEDLLIVHQKLESLAHKANDDQDLGLLKRTQHKLFYVCGNISIIEDVLVTKTGNVFEFTEYADICFN